MPPEDLVGNPINRGLDDSQFNASVREKRSFAKINYYADTAV